MRAAQTVKEICGGTSETAKGIDAIASVFCFRLKNLQENP